MDRAGVRDPPRKASLKRVGVIIPDSPRERGKANVRWCPRALLGWYTAVAPQETCRGYAGTAEVANCSANRPLSGLISLPGRVCGRSSSPKRVSYQVYWESRKSRLGSSFVWKSERVLNRERLARSFTVCGPLGESWPSTRVATVESCASFHYYQIQLPGRRANRKFERQRGAHGHRVDYTSERRGWTRWHIATRCSPTARIWILSGLYLRMRVAGLDGMARTGVAMSGDAARTSTCATVTQAD